MLKVRVIPTMLWKDLGLVKGVSFQSWRRLGAVLPAIKVYNSRDVDELHLVDITANRDPHDLDYDSINDFSFKGKIKGKIGTFSFKDKKVIQELNIYKTDKNKFIKF